MTLDLYKGWISLSSSNYLLACRQGLLPLAMYKYINTQNMASDQTKVLNTIAKYNYNTFIHTQKNK